MGKPSSKSRLSNSNSIQRSNSIHRSNSTRRSTSQSRSDLVQNKETNPLLQSSSSLLNQDESSSAACSSKSKSSQSAQSNNFQMNVESDDTEKDCSDDDLVNQKFKNNTRSKYPSVRHHFMVMSRKKDKSYYECQLTGCLDKCVKTSAGSDGNLRLHLANYHNMDDVLYDSQKKRKNGIESSGVNIIDKKQIDNAVVECILTDSRTFNDFNKIGMLGFLNAIKPGYKPPSRHLVRKCIKKRYSFNFKN